MMTNRSILAYLVAKKNTGYLTQVETLIMAKPKHTGLFLVLFRGKKFHTRLEVQVTKNCQVDF